MDGIPVVVMEDTPPTIGNKINKHSGRKIQWKRE